jgi:hypothetical protein
MIVCDRGSFRRCRRGNGRGDRICGGVVGGCFTPPLCFALSPLRCFSFSKDYTRISHPSCKVEICAVAPVSKFSDLVVGALH